MLKIIYSVLIDNIDQTQNEILGLGINLIGINVSDVTSQTFVFVKNDVSNEDKERIDEQMRVTAKRDPSAVAPVPEPIVEEERTVPA